MFYLMSAFYTAFHYDFPQCVQTSLYAYMDAETQTSDPQLERDQIPKVKDDQQRLDANNRRERLRRSIYFGSETEQQREIRLRKHTIFKSLSCSTVIMIPIHEQFAELSG